MPTNDEIILAIVELEEFNDSCSDEAIVYGKSIDLAVTALEFMLTHKDGVI